MIEEGEVEYGAHLPLTGLGTGRSLAALKDYTRAAAALGFRYLCANDHLLFSRPWLDGPTALAAVIDESEGMRLATTVSLPVLRGPVPLAKTLAALDVLSGGRLVVGVGPGSSAADYAAAGLRFEERWRRFDEAVRALRALLHGNPDGFEGEFYATRGVVLQPRPPQRPGPPLWVASWGSPAGLRRVARLGDGWLASAYNTTPDRLREALDSLAGALRRAGRPPGSFPTAVATTWLHVTEDRAAAERTLTEVLAPMLNRPVEALRCGPLPIGPAELCAERLAGLVAAGARRIFVWPLGDEVRQLELFRERVVPLLARRP
ncbi:MAG TPA: LLM class flavin-dependent oxidoreductase [Actinomycetes bacterium]|jgi:alkanesulfonate monooxygenase SsuD/methylene tetrahydromethanopterin reductase-like flavin-dependent oxidoreductase (luciferase family)|nr:LLM class flavin-dependent oxidoreductase [Actinomycetes bacterium]